MKVTIAITIFVAGLLCSGAWAQEKAQDKGGAAKKKGGAPAAKGAPAMPKPAAEMADLRALIGTWTSEETMEESPFGPAGTGTGTNTVRLGPGGFSVLMEHRAKNAMGSFVGHGVLSWDPEEKVYKTSWVDSMTPGIMTSVGKKEGANVVYTGHMTMNGKKITTKDVISDRTPTSYTFTSYIDDGSGEKKMMTMKLTKQETPAGAPKK